MQLRKMVFRAAASFLATGFFCLGGAQQLSVDINAGVSQPIGSNADRWNTGFSVGGDGFIWVFDRLGIGGRFAYNRWSPDKDAFLDGFDAITDPDVKGSLMIFEIIPSARVRTNYETSPLNFFGQGGFGLYVIRTEAELSGLQLDSPVEDVFNDGEWIGRWGFQLGAGVSLGSSRYFSVDIFPLYNIVFNSDRAFQYFTGNVGLSFKF